MKHRILTVVSIMTLVLAACGDGGGTTTTGAAGEETTAAGDGATTTAAEAGGTTEAPVEGGGETINIVANPWTASALNAEIAAQLIESELGNPAEVVAIDENTMFTGLSDGSLDVVLEVWPSGIVAEEQAFIDDGSVVDIGELGAIGKIGWFTPQYVIDEHPEVVAAMREAYEQWWKETRPMMVNEGVPMSPVRPFHQLYARQLAERGIPKWLPPVE